MYSPGCHQFHILLQVKSSLPLKLLEMILVPLAMIPQIVSSISNSVMHITHPFTDLLQYMFTKIVLYVCHIKRATISHSKQSIT